MEFKYTTFLKENADKKPVLKFKFENKNYKFNLHMSAGRYCFTDKKEFGKNAPEEFLKTATGTNTSEFCTSPQSLKDFFRKRGATDVKIEME